MQEPQPNAGQTSAPQSPSPVKKQKQPKQPKAKRPKEKSQLASTLFILIIVSIVAIVALLGALFFFQSKTSSDTGTVTREAANVLEPTATAPLNRDVVSKLGVTVPYNIREFNGFGVSGNATFAASDLDESRVYESIRVRPLETSEAVRNAIAIGSPELKVTTNKQKDFWNALQRNKTYKDLSKVDALVKQTIDQRTKNKKTVTASDVSVQTIGSVEYKKVSFTTSDEMYSVATRSREDCYAIVQNDRPYVLCISNIRPSNFASLPQIESLIAGVSYNQPDQAALVGTKKTDQAAVVADNKTPEATATNQQSSEEEAGKATQEQQASGVQVLSTDSFKAIAEAALATVRIGTIYCADFTLAQPDQSGPGIQLTGACVDKGGTGSIISSDGLIATTGSVVKVTQREALQAYISNATTTDQMFERLQRVLKYLVEAREMSQSDADAIISGTRIADKNVIDKVNSLADLIPEESVTLNKESYSYAVQLSDKPIVVNDETAVQPTFAYTDLVVKADLFAAEFTGEKTLTQVYSGDNPDKNTAILKIGDGSAKYPALALAPSSNPGTGTPLQFVGYPMYSEGGVQSAQLRAVPLVRQGKVDQVFTVANSQKLVAINTPSHAGLDGAPVVDDSAKLVALASYGTANCPEAKCFGVSVVRDTADISAILKERNVDVKHSSVSETWSKALTELAKGNFQGAESLFTEVDKAYPTNQFAKKFAELTKSQRGSVGDTSTENTTVGVLKIFLIIFAVLLILLIAARTAIRAFTRPKYRTQYGQLAGATGQAYIPSDMSAGQWGPTVTTTPVQQQLNTTQSASAWQQPSERQQTPVVATNPRQTPQPTARPSQQSYATQRPSQTTQTSVTEPEPTTPPEAPAQ